LEAGEFISRGADILGVDIADLRLRGRNQDAVRARELLMVLGVERYGLKVKDLAKELRKSPDGMTQTVMRGIRRRSEDDEFRADLLRLDQAISEARD